MRWVVILAVVTQGCSLIRVRGPEVRGGTVDDCRQSYALPLVDLGIGLGALAVSGAGVYAATISPYEDDPDNRNPRGTRALAIASVVILGASTATLFGISGVVGWRKVSACRDARQRYSIRRPAPPEEYIPSKEARAVHVVTHGAQISGCRLLGRVQGEPVEDGRTGGPYAKHRAAWEMRAAAARLGADTVLLPSPLLVSVGDAYDCSDKTGCLKDTDCKGDRICVEGACEDPGP